MSEKTYYQRSCDVKPYCQRDVILNRAKDYYENDKETLKKEAKDKYRNLSEEEKIKRENIEVTGIIICLKKKSKN